MQNFAFYVIPPQSCHRLEHREKHPDEAYFTMVPGLGKGKLNIHERQLQNKSVQHNVEDGYGWYSSSGQIFTALYSKFSINHFMKLFHMYVDNPMLCTNTLTDFSLNNTSQIYCFPFSYMYTNFNQYSIRLKTEQLYRNYVCARLSYESINSVSVPS